MPQPPMRATPEEPANEKEPTFPSMEQDPDQWVDFLVEKLVHWNNLQPDQAKELLNRLVAAGFEINANLHSLQHGGDRKDTALYLVGQFMDLLDRRAQNPNIDALDRNEANLKFVPYEKLLEMCWQFLLAMRIKSRL
ncbi:hypothetical protein KGQ71_04685 [Patescibacteria group bacterium]|nr:hypothetical protein [Patescibacteria group bacterium]